MKAFLITVLASVGAAAVVSAADDARATYERDRAACVSGRTGQERSACLREAAAVYKEARSGRRAPALPNDSYAQNALARCQPLPASERAECETRMRSGTTSGSVTGGGVLRELRTVEPAAPGTAPADAAQPSMPSSTAPVPAPAVTPVPSPGPAADAEHQPTPSPASPTPPAAPR